MNKAIAQNNWNTNALKFVKGGRANSLYNYSVKDATAKKEEALPEIILPQKKKVAIPTADGLDFVQVQDIIRCEGSNKYTKVYIKGKNVLLCSYNIGKFRLLLNQYGFFLTHKSHLINLSCIKKYYKEGNIMLDDSSVVPVSIRKRQDFLNCIQRL